MKVDNYKNKTFSILGDSVSTLEGYSTPEYCAFYDTDKKLESGVITPQDTWWGMVVSALGGRVLVNNSISGSTVTYSPLYEIPSYACSNERTSSLHLGSDTPNVIMVYIGTNDFGAGVLIDGDNESDNTVFSVAYKNMLKKLKNNYPLAEIWCFTLAKSRYLKKPSFEFPYLYGGTHIEKYCNAITKIATELNLKVIDLYNNAEPYDTIDGFHPNKSGMTALSTAVLKSVLG